MVGEVVVVLDGLEGGLLTIEAKVVDSDGFGEERGQGRDHGEARAKDGHEGDGGGWGRSGGGGVGVAEGGLVALSWVSLEALGEGLVANHQGNVVHQRLHVLGAGACRAQLRELRLQARVLRDMGVLGKGGHGECERSGRGPRGAGVGPSVFVASTSRHCAGYNQSSVAALLSMQGARRTTTGGADLGMIREGGREGRGRGRGSVHAALSLACSPVVGR